jgi:hypothetical protein
LQINDSLAVYCKLHPAEKQGELRDKTRGDLLFFRVFPPPGLGEGRRVGVGISTNLAITPINASLMISKKTNKNQQLPS